VHNILTGPGHLAALREHCSRLDEISAVVEANLPAPMNRHCRVANVTDGVLVLVSAGTGWSTRLRFHAPQLLDALRARPGLGHLREIRVRPAPPKAVEAGEALRIPHLPAQAARHLRAAADAISAPALRAALLRLASRGRADG